MKYISQRFSKMYNVWFIDAWVRRGHVTETFLKTGSLNLQIICNLQMNFGTRLPMFPGRLPPFRDGWLSQAAVQLEQVVLHLPDLEVVVEILLGDVRGIDLPQLTEPGLVVFSQSLVLDNLLRLKVQSLKRFIT